MTSVTPKKAASAINTSGLHTDNNKADFPTGAVIEQVPCGKAIATEIARLALAGHTVHKGGSGDFTACKYGMSKWCQDFAELQAFSRKLGLTK